MKADKAAPLFIAALLAKKKKGRELADHESVGKDEDEMDPKGEALSAMEDLISAIHAKDASMALKCWDQLCELHEQSEGPEEEKEEGSD